MEDLIITFEENPSTGAGGVNEPPHTHSSRTATITAAEKQRFIISKKKE